MRPRDAEISRRSFAIGAVGAAVACATGTAWADEGAADDGLAWDVEADVVVVGSGAAGHAAAIESVRAGARTVMLEKTDIVGGDSVMCDGILGGWGTRLARECGAEVTADEIYDLFMANPDWYGPHDPTVARVAADKCGETIDWLEDLGVPFEAEVASRFNYTDLPAIHQVDGKGAKMIEVLAAVARQEGVEVMTATAAVRLVVEDGRAVGVVAVQDGVEITVGAALGVILATGGYGASYDMLVALDPENEGIIPTSGPGMTGDGIVMAQELGAHVTRTGYQPMMYAMGGLGTGATLTIDYESRLHGILLDASGHRFCNEGMEFLSRQVPREVLHKYNEQQGMPAVYLLPTTEGLAELTGQEGFDWVAYETAGEACAMLGLDASQVEETVARYNEFVEEGVDEDFGRPADDMMLLTGPFYATTALTITNVTTGGLKTDAEARVLRLKNPGDDGEMLRPIPGLYAAGEVCEWNVAAGWTVCTAVTMGRIAGANAAAGV